MSFERRPFSAQSIDRVTLAGDRSKLDNCNRHWLQGFRNSKLRLERTEASRLAYVCSLKAAGAHLFAKRATLPGRQVQVQVVAMRLVCFRTKHCPEYPTRTFVNSAQESCGGIRLDVVQ